MAGVAIVLVAVVWLVVIYHLGHLIAGRLLGFELSVFSVGFGPLLASFTLGRTRYELRLILFGGYVRAAKTERSLRYMAFICSGPLSNLLAAFVLMWIALRYGVNVVSLEGAEIVDMSAATLEADLREGDVVVQAGGQATRDAIALERELSKWREGDIALRVRRNDDLVTVLVRHPKGNGEGNAGHFGVVARPATEWRALARPPAARDGAVHIIKAWTALWFGRQAAGAPDKPLPASPKPTQGDTWATLSLIALGFAVLNMMPFPAFIGSEALYTLICVVTRQSVSRAGRRIVAVTQVVLSLALVVMIVLMHFSDLRLMPPEALSALAGWASSP